MEPDNLNLNSTKRNYKEQEKQDFLTTESISFFLFLSPSISLSISWSAPSRPLTEKCEMYNEANGKDLMKTWERNDGRILLGLFCL